MHWAAVYEVRMRVGNKKIFHLEAWVVKVMSLYKVCVLPVHLLRVDSPESHSISFTALTCPASTDILFHIPLYCTDSASLL